MRVLRGRAGNIEADREASTAMVERAATTGEPALRVWTPHRQVAFGRRDARNDGYDRARRAARARGYPPVEREVGGQAVAYTGSTVAVSYAVPTDERTAIGSRYGVATDRLLEALASLGIDARQGEPDRAFCPGTHSLQAAGKIAGLAQRVRREVAVVGGIVVVCDDRAIGQVLDPVYEALGVPFDPDSVGSVAAAGGPADPAAVVRAVEDAFAQDGTGDGDGISAIERVS